MNALTAIQVGASSQTDRLASSAPIAAEVEAARDARHAAGAELARPRGRVASAVRGRDSVTP